MGVVEVTKENFNKEVVSADKKVLVEFWAPWCGHCKQMAPVIEELADEMPEIKVCTVNGAEQGELASKIGVNCVPTIIIVENGKVAKQSVGYVEKDKILELLA